jgi:single-strand DNA-binding protein
MFNEAHVTLSGNVASEPHYQTVGQDIPKLSMRVVWTTRRRDAATGEWVDGNTSGVNVTCWRKLAENLSMCLHKGDPVFVTGKLEVRNFVGKDGQRKTAVDVNAYTLGHDLTRGVAHFRRFSATAGKTAVQQAAELADGEAGDRHDAVAPGGMGGDIGSEATALADMADGDLVPGTDADDDMFDDSAIDALAKETDSVATPF